MLCEEYFVNLDYDTSIDTMGNNTVTTKTKRDINNDEGILIIDSLLSSGWTSYIDMDILLHKYHRSLLESLESLTNVDEIVMKIDPAVLSDEDYKLRLMEECGYLYTNRVKQYFYHMSEVWTQVHYGVADKKKIGSLIENQWINRDNCKKYALSDSTLTYLYKGKSVKRIRVFRYIESGYSIASDLRFYNDKVRRHSVARAQKQITSGVKYNSKDAPKFLVSPDPDVIERKISALKIRALQEALYRETNEAIKRRIAEIEYLTSEKPVGWENRTINLYLNAIYDASGKLDNSEIEPIIQQLRSHMLNHFKLEYFPSNCIDVILDYNKYCSRKQHPQVFQSVSSLAKFIMQDEFTAEDIDIIREKGWIACCNIDDLDDDSFEEVATLHDAIWLLLNSTTYIYNLSGFSAALILYGIDGDISLNTIVSCVYAQLDCLIRNFTNDYADYFNSAESAFLGNCRSIIGSLDRDNAIERFIIGLVYLSTSFVTRTISQPFDDIFPKAILAEGLQHLNPEEKKHFEELFQTLRFEEYYKVFVSVANCDVLSQDTQDAFIILMMHLIENLAAGYIWLEKESYHHQKLVLDLKEYMAKVSKDSRCERYSAYCLLLKYAVIVIEYNPYPMDIRDGCIPNLCKDSLQAIADEASQVGLNDKEKALLFLLLSMIALRHIDYYIFKEDDEEEKRLNSGIKEKAMEFLPISEYFLDKMGQGQTKDILAETLASIRKDGFYNGYIL